MDRRDFITKSGLVGSSALVAPSVLNAFTFGKANETINIGVIGTGDRGGGLISVINKLDHLNVVACCDTLPFRLEKALAKTDGKAKGYSDYRKLLDDKDVDAVIVATPFGTHSQICIDALEAGKHVYGEKTMSRGFEETIDLVDTVKESGLIFQTGHQYHSSRLYAHVVEDIRNGKVGKISSIDCQWNRNGDWRRPVPSPEYERQINWRMYRENSGGLLAELCSHQLDFTNWVLGTTPDKVMGIGGINYWKDGRETYDNIHLIYGYPNGVKATFGCLTSNAKDDYQIKVLGDKGCYTLGYLTAWFHPEGDYKKEVTEVDGVSGATIKWDVGKGQKIDITHLEPSKQALLDFEQAVKDNKEPESNVYTGAKASFCVQMGLDAMYNDEIVVANQKQWKKIKE